MYDQHAFGAGPTKAQRDAAVAAENDAQMLMYDELGPKARRAIDDSLRLPDIRALKKAFKTSWVNAWFEKHGIDGAPPPQSSFADLDDEFSAFIIEKTEVVCPVQGKTLTCLQPKKLKRTPPSRWSRGPQARSSSATSQS